MPNPAHVGKFKTGARPTPRHVLAAAHPFVPVTVPPPQFGVVPSKLSMWGNRDHGNCVSAEEWWAKAVASLMNGGTEELFLDEASCIAWATQHGFLEGAYLTDVMDTMLTQGPTITATGGSQQYNDGSRSTVDWSNEVILQSAISTGPVKLGLDSTALPPDAGSIMGWYATGGSVGQFPNEDHCTGLSGYGGAGYLFDLMKATLPAALKADQQGYAFYTWSSYGFVDHDWLMACVAEAWARTPTTVGVPPLPGPGPTPPPVPTGAYLFLPPGFPDGTHPIGGTTPGTIPAGSSLLMLDGGGAMVTPPGKRK